MNATLYGKSDFAVVIKDNEMGTLFWITYVGLTCNHKYPQKEGMLFNAQQGKKM